MKIPLEEPLLCVLEEALMLHAIDASIFTPFAIERLRTRKEESFAELLVKIQDEQTQREYSRYVRIQWSPESAFRRPVAVQDRVVTEWAALGVACAILPTVLNIRVLSVALDGERFDYRIGNEKGEYGFEVSGTLTEDSGGFQERHRQKVRQLRENPFGIGGYVVVVGFVRKEAFLTFHLPQQEVSI